MLQFTFDRLAHDQTNGKIRLYKTNWVMFKSQGTPHPSPSYSTMHSASPTPSAICREPHNLSFSSTRLGGERCAVPLSLPPSRALADSSSRRADSEGLGAVDGLHFGGVLAVVHVVVADVGPDGGQHGAEVGLLTRVAQRRRVVCPLRPRLRLGRLYVVPRQACE